MNMPTIGRETVALRLNRTVLRREMARLHISQAELAGRAGMHRNSIHLLLSGQREPSLATVDALARALNVSPFTLLTDEADEED